MARKEPAGKPIVRCAKVPVRLTAFYDPDGVVLDNDGTVALRSVRAKGIIVRTRGFIADIGPDPTHMREISILLGQGHTTITFSSLVACKNAKTDDSSAGDTDADADSDTDTDADTDTDTDADTDTDTDADADVSGSVTLKDGTPVEFIGGIAFEFKSAHHLDLTSQPVPCEDQENWPDLHEGMWYGLNVLDWQDPEMSMAYLMLYDPSGFGFVEEFFTNITLTQGDTVEGGTVAGTLTIFGDSSGKEKRVGAAFTVQHCGSLEF